MWIVGETATGVPVLNVYPEFSVDAEQAGVGIGMLVLDADVAPGTEVVATWNGLRVAHTF